MTLRRWESLAQLAFVKYTVNFCHHFQIAALALCVAVAAAGGGYGGGYGAQSHVNVQQ